LRLAAFALALMLALATALGLAACASSEKGSGGAADDTAGDGTTTYHNAEFGFSITYPERYTEAEAETAGEAGGSAVSSVAFADPDGTVVGDLTVDGLQVAVYELAQGIALEQVPELEQEFQGLVDQMIAGLENGAVTDPLGAVELNGLPGFGFSFTYTNQGTELRASTLFLVKGRYEYMVTAQAATDRWDEMAPELEAAAMSFTID